MVEQSIYPKDQEMVITTSQVNFFYGPTQALFDISLLIPTKHVTALIGPSGCGKSTFLRCLNRMNDTIPHSRVEGEIFINQKDIYAPGTDVVELRKEVGMVFQKSNPFPKSIFDNVAYGPRIHGEKDPKRLAEIVEQSLQQAAIWDEVKDRLHANAMGLSGGQQQRLCIARTIALEPEILLMDEPTSAIDPVATRKVEELAESLKGNFTIAIVTHSMQQAARISDFTAFFYKGHIVEYGLTRELFTNPKQQQTEDYITGRFG